MIRRWIVSIQDWVDDNLRRLCGRITPEKRIVVLLIMFLLFSSACLYIFISAIYRIGKNEGQHIEIEHIKQLQLHEEDSINHLKFYDNGRAD